MGYTHYWRPETQIDEKTFEIISGSARKVLDVARTELKIRLAYDFDKPAKDPVFTNELIRFNGTGNEGHETFYISREDTGFSFCKTARKPYDIVAVAVLCLADYYSEGRFAVGSDGGIDDWKDGLSLARHIEPSCTLPNGVRE